jgi:membrane fusion protein (multidrug efflux system)
MSANRIFRARKCGGAVSLAASIAVSMLLLAACGQTTGSGPTGNGGAVGPITVGYVIVQPTSVPIVQDLPARISANRIADVRPQVSGIILRQLFTEGSIVRQGQTLYQIDPSLYRAAAAQAAANVQAARASAAAAGALAARYKPLAEMQAVAEQDYTNAVAAARQANAGIAQNAAALRIAQINVRFTRVPAPITGRIGLSNFSEGALATADQANALTTITQLDPINVDIQQGASELLNLRQSLRQGGVAPAMAQVRLLLPDGSDYGTTGVVQFSAVIVNQATGTVTLRASFPNPQSILLPGMFVKARFAQAVNTTAFLVPQQALSRDPRGNATIWVVGPGSTAVQRTVVATDTRGPNWVVTQGLAPGEKVITQGIARLRQGATIKPVPATAPQHIQAPSANATKGS